MEKMTKTCIISFLIIIGFCFIVSEHISSSQSNSFLFNKEHILLQDSPTTDLTKFFIYPHKEYHLRYNHVTTDTISIPDSCSIYFEGGSIAGPIIFNHTRLSGQVKLYGSSLSGSITNDIFDASWICHMDGKTDDATIINQIINITNNIFFPKGDYYLKNFAIPSNEIPKELLRELKCHIGINKSNINIFGEDETKFISESPNVMICAYSRPYDIDNSISNVNIYNITLVENNDKKSFHEFAHTIKLIGINNCTISNCRFEDFWGDAINLGHYGDTPSTGERTRNQNIKIINNYITGKSHNNRNAISVINGKNISIINNSINQVSSSKMPGAIDIEANNSAYTIDGITVSSNKINGSNGMGGAIGVVSLHNAPAHRIIIEHNTITNSTAGIAFGIKSDDCVSDISVISNYIDDNTRPFIFSGNSRTKNWIFKGNNTSFDNKKLGGSIKINNLVKD